MEQFFESESEPDNTNTTNDNLNEARLGSHNNATSNNLDLNAIKIEAEAIIVYGLGLRQRLLGDRDHNQLLSRDEVEAKLSLAKKNGYDDDEQERIQILLKQFDVIATNPNKGISKDDMVKRFKSLVKTVVETGKKGNWSKEEKKVLQDMLDEACRLDLPGKNNGLIDYLKTIHPGTYELKSGELKTGASGKSSLSIQLYDPIKKTVLDDFNIKVNVLRP